MKNYLNLLEKILAHGLREPNRTGIDTLTLPGETLQFDLRDGFPAVTTKRLAFNQVKGELIGFLRGSSSLAEFKALGCDVWDANVNSPAWQWSKHIESRDDMGRIYGVQWRDWSTTGLETQYDSEENSEEVLVRYSVDQIAIALNTLRNDPSSRRIIVNAWNPAELDQACLPPCHVLFQLHPRSDGTLHMTMYQRSCDMFLGVPFNIASYALLLELFAAWSGRTAATLTMFLADAHIYVNHVDQVKEQLSREPMELPRLMLTLPIGMSTLSADELIRCLEPDHLELVGYNCHPAIKAPMAV